MTKEQLRKAPADPKSALDEILRNDKPLARRYGRVIRQAVRARVSEYHLTNSCNIRCKGCWFFETGHDHATGDESDLNELSCFLEREHSERRVNGALIIGGEPTLHPDRLEVYARHMRYITVSTNGLIPLSRERFPEVAVGITMFGGGPLDDELRGYGPTGKHFTGLFDRALRNYHNDPRAGFVYAVTDDGVDYVAETVDRIAENGNRVTFNYYSDYRDMSPREVSDRRERLIEAMLVAKQKYPDVVNSHPYYIRTLITGESDGVHFGYDVCPSISRDHPGHARRMRNGNPTLSFFNTWAADLKTVKFCCTSGHCEMCRDSQAVQSWLLVSRDRFLQSRERLLTWIEVAEGYWSQFVWSEYHPLWKDRAGDGAVRSTTPSWPVPVPAGGGSGGNHPGGRKAVL